MKKIVFILTVSIAIAFSTLRIQAKDNQVVKDNTITIISSGTNSPRGIILDPIEKHVYLSGSEVKGTIIFHVTLQSSGGRTTISNAYVTHDLKVTSSTYPGKLQVVINSINPRVGSAYTPGQVIKIDYTVSIGGVPVVISSTTMI